MYKKEFMKNLGKLNEKYLRINDASKDYNLEKLKDNLVLMGGSVRYFCETYLINQKNIDFKNNPQIDIEIKRIYKEVVNGLENENYLTLNMFLDIENSTIVESKKEDSNALERLISAINSEQ